MKKFKYIKLVMMMAIVIVLANIFSITSFAATNEIIYHDFYSAEVIKEACNGRATVQDDREACLVSLDGHNPYDVTWDYGIKYTRYVEACDWSLVFDAEYYKKAYPMLATLYNQDDALLLEHFQTVGVHEGRQGKDTFNVEAYLNNCDYHIYMAFKGDVEGAYIYYMLHYDSEKSVNTVTCSDGSAPRTQLFNIYTILQQNELDHINDYREEVGAEDVTLNGELCALANYRAYINRVNGVVYGHAHDWLINNQDMAWKYIGFVSSDSTQIGENAITSHGGLIYKDYAYLYRRSPEHYDCMINSNYSLVGISNIYISPDTGMESQIDFFISNN